VCYSVLTNRTAHKKGITMLYRSDDLLVDDDHVAVEYEFKGDYEFYRLLARSRNLEYLKYEYRGATIRYLTSKEYKSLPMLPRYEK